MCQSGEDNKAKLKIKVAEEMQAEKKGKIIAAILLLEALGFIPASVSLGSSLQRYVYGTTLDSIAKVTGIVKFDLHAAPEVGKTEIEVGGNVQGLYDLGPDRFGSEAIFDPPPVLSITSEEDDGYLIFFVHDENTGKSAIHVLDAKTMSSAVVELPQRVPYGFHAFFVTEEQLQEQANF